MDNTNTIENEPRRAWNKTTRTIDESIDSSVASLASGFKAVVADAEELLSATASYSGEGFIAAREKFKARLDAAKGTLAQTQAAVSDKAEQAAAVTEKYVSENPWKSIAMVGSVGIILGMLLHRR
jgi:ElaB/YqjD/DUF883 family membrane-anchored ribosome-binding protein